MHRACKSAFLCLVHARHCLNCPPSLSAVQNYSSNSTVDLLADMAAEAAAFSQEVAAEGAPPPPAAEPLVAASAAGSACGAQAGPLSSCEALDRLPFGEWEEQQAEGSSANSSWAWAEQPAALPPVDWPAVAEAVCECLTRAQEQGTGNACRPDGSCAHGGFGSADAWVSSTAAVASLPAAANPPTSCVLQASLTPPLLSGTATSLWSTGSHSI